MEENSIVVARLKAMRDALLASGQSLDQFESNEPRRVDRLTQRLLAMPDAPERQRMMMIEDLRQGLHAGGAVLDRVRLGRVLDAMAHVPREYFVHPDAAAFAYLPTPISIGHGQTISHPQMVAAILYGADLQPHHHVLDIGCGCGYQAALAAQLAARVTGIELVEALAHQASCRLAEIGCLNVTVFSADARTALENGRRFHSILVAAGAAAVPGVFMRALTVGGRLVMPVGPAGEQRLIVLERHGEAEWRGCSLGPARFVPLLGEPMPDDWTCDGEPLCLGAPITLISDDGALPSALQ